jgi:hypothetical protein
MSTAEEVYELFHTVGRIASGASQGKVLQAGLLLLLNNFKGK